MSRFTSLAIPARAGLALGSALLLVACDGSVVEPVSGGRSPGTVVAPAATGSLPGYALPHADAQRAAIHALQSAFHGALRNQDADAVRALWTDDATLSAVTPGGPVSASGVDEITTFFEGSPPFVNGWAALAPTYKSRVEIHGDTAEFGFECVYVAEAGNLAGQVVVAHLNATGTMRKVGDRWLFQRFQGGVGPLP